MGISYSSIKLIKYILDKKRVNVKNTAIHFNKNESTIRREIYNINLYSKGKKIILLENGLLKTSLNYTEYTKFIQSISINEYFSTPDERINIILISALLNDYVNLTTLYDDLGLSIATKKNDTKLLKAVLKDNNLTLNVLKKKGVKIEGKENTFRLLVTKKLHSIMDVNINNGLEKRKANTPFENYAFNLFLKKIHSYTNMIDEKLSYFTKNISVNISYLSRKFLILYLCVATFRQNNGYNLKSVTNIPLRVTNRPIFNKELENQEFSNIVAILDTDPCQPFHFDKNLLNLCTSFIDNLSFDMNITLIKKSYFINEIYNFMYKQICSQYLNISFDDKLVNNVEITLPRIHEAILDNQQIFTEEYKIKLNNIQISTLSLIIKKWLNITDSVKRNSLKIILVTNIVYERVQFFEELLKSYYDITLVGVFTLYDIEKIKTIEHDFIILFSNRMLSVIREEFKNAVKVNFFLSDDDIKLLNSLGFKSSRKRISLDDFINDIKNKPKEHLKKYIKENYDDYFF
jgi:transcriptional antiterminator